MASFKGYVHVLNDMASINNQIPAELLRAEPNRNTCTLGTQQCYKTSAAEKRLIGW